MSDTRTLFQFLTQSRIKLNLIFLITRILTWFAWIGTFSGVIFLVARWSGWFSINIELWFLISLLGSLFGFIIGWRQRLDNYATASWLDEHLQSDELLSAALVCLNRDCSGSFDQRIIDSANKFSENPNKVRWPMRFLLKKIGIVTVVIIFFIAGLLYLPFFLNSNNIIFKSAEIKESIGKSSRQKNRQLVVESPRTLAKVLFPEDDKMAMLVERALREGNLAVLQNLLRDAELNMERLIAEAANPEEQRRLINEVEQRRQLMETLIAQSQQRNQTGPATREGEDPTSSGLDVENGKEQTKNENRLAKGNSPQKDHSNQNEMKPEDQNPYSSISYGGNKAGSGHNPNEGNWGKIIARTGREETIISKNKDSQMLEYLLPGKKARLPLSKVVPDAEQSAEAAIHRQGIPFEYEDFIRNYFLLLAKESKEAATKEAQK